MHYRSIKYYYYYYYYYYIITNRRTSLDFDATKYDSLNMASIDFHYLWVIPNLFRS